MKSMTGFGRGEASSSEGVRFRVEMSSVNRKQADVVVNISRDYSELDLSIRKIVGEMVSRGRVVVNVTIDKAQSLSQELTIDEPLADQYYKAAARLAKKHKIETMVTTAEILRSPGVVSVSDHIVEPKEAWPHIQKALTKAMTAFERTRKSEGAHLKKDLQQRLRAVKGLVKSIDAKAPGVVEHYRTNLRRRLEESGLPLPLDDERLLKEIGIYAERSDISEELTRLASHLKQFVSFLSAEDPHGRAMDFLAQELNRELNTIGAKANNAGIAQFVVAGKTEVEKIREQVQNVE